MSSTQGQVKPAAAPNAAEPRRASRRAMEANSDRYKWPAIGLAAMFALTLPTILAVIVLAQPEPPVPAWTLEAAALGVDRLEISVGERVYRNSCAVCHGPSGEGVPRLGKPVRNSAFVQAQSDADLFQLIANGRPVSDPLNTTGALMPPRGAQGLGDGQIGSVVTYLRAIQDPAAATASVAPWELKDAQGGAAASAAIEITAHPGYQLFVSSCSACHGQGGQGIESQGLPLTTSGFVRGMSDKDLITFIKTGRSSWDENNTTGIDMPPKGGNPAVTEEDLRSIVEYIRALQKEALGS